MNTERFFKKIHTKEMRKQRVNTDLQQQLAQQLFHSPLKKKSVWNRFSFRLFIFSSISIAVFVLVTIINSPYSGMNNDSIIANVENQIIDPKIALAESLHNTFGTDSFASSFGLAKTENFLHRTFTIMLHEEKDPNFPEDTFVGTQENIDLWVYGNNIRKDMQYFSKNPFEQKIEGYSQFISEDEQLFCSRGYQPPQQTDEFDTKNYWCDDITAYAKRETETAISGMGFNSEINSALIAEIRTEQFYDEMNGPSVNIEWSTEKPLSGAWFSEYSYPNGGGGGDIFNYEKNSQFYTNRFEDGKYWHGHPTNLWLENQDGNIYFQIQESGKGSSIYEYHFNDNSIREISYEEFEEIMNRYNKKYTFMQGEYESVLQPTLYMMKHPEEFTEPIQVWEDEVKNEIHTTHMRFELPKHFYAEANQWNFMGARTNIKYIDIWYEPYEKKIVAYSILDKDLQSVIDVSIQDEIVQGISPETFFSSEFWKKDLTR